MALTTLNLKHSRARLTDILAKHIDIDDARTAVQIATKELGIESNWFDRDQALQILDQLGRNSDKVGAIARLVKVRVRLDWDNLSNNSQ